MHNADNQPWFLHPVKQMLAPANAVCPHPNEQRSPIKLKLLEGPEKSLRKSLGLIKEFAPPSIFQTSQAFP
jgi:hypothetical protein